MADPDGLLQEESILAILQERGYALLAFEDPLAFRLAWASRPDDHPVLVWMAAEEDELRRLPWDVWSAGPRLALNVGRVFPRLNFPVVRELAPQWFDLLYEAYRHYEGETLGEHGTREFLLRALFRVAPWELRDPARLLVHLLQRHYRREMVSPETDRFVIDRIRDELRLVDWPLADIMGGRAEFLAFLQAQWPHFLWRAATLPASPVAELRSAPALPPIQVPFEDPEARVYVDTYFLEGLLSPVLFEHPERLTGAYEWARVGVRRDDAGDARARAARLLVRVRDEAPAPMADHRIWADHAWRLAELTVQLERLDPRARASLEEERRALTSQSQAAFYHWLEGRFAGLATLPHHPAPVMVHHIPRFLASRLAENPDRRLALVVLDGLALDQWLVLREALPESLVPVNLEERMVFSWIPTLTGISRLSLFAGEVPRVLGKDLFRTETEPRWWKRFWSDRGLGAREVGYLRELEELPHPGVDAMLENPALRVLGLVVPTVDKMIHGLPASRHLLHDTFRTWAREGLPSALLSRLLEAGFEVYLASDHGNAEGRGIGEPKEGSLADVTGKRCRIYPDAALRTRVQEKFPSALPWSGRGLPDGWHALLSSPGELFYKVGATRTSHGGATLEEVVAPFIRIWRET